MALIEQPTPALALRGGDERATASTSYGVFRRPVETTGWRSWLFTVDHKKLGIMYGVAAFAFFIVGGIEALLIRAQLAGPDGTLLSADLYNQMFTMHATSMVFLFAMPMAAAFGNYFIPLQIGARDVAFPRTQRLRLLVLPGRRHRRQPVVVPRRRRRRRLVHVRPELERAVLAHPRHRLLGCSVCRSPASPR